MSSLCFVEQKNRYNEQSYKYHLALMPLPTQIAGHGSEGDGQRAILKREDGKLLKPVQPPPKGPREAKFYLDINASKGNFDIIALLPSLKVRQRLFTFGFALQFHEFYKVDFF